ncbi:MAG: nicotinate (nicotinamide) nucleotide adenylyltransferase [Pseudobdellovibrionaceae bacterium]
MRVGIFGGSFNPPHLGHLNLMASVQKKAGLEKVFVVPSSQSPLKHPVEGPTPEQRLDLVKIAASQYGEQFVIDDQEIRRKGVSYTIDTIRAYRKEYKAEDLFLILGADTFESLPEWKSFKDLLKETNFIIATRPGHSLPTAVDELPEALKEFVAEFDMNYIELTTGRSIQFITLKDVDISATDLRKRLRTGRSLEKYLPLGVENHIRDNKFYQPLGAKIADYADFTKFVAGVLFDRKGINVKGFDLRELTAPSEYAIVCSGTSSRHSASLAENVIQQVKEEYGVLPQSIEGLEEGRWVLLDYGSLILHVFYDFVRQEYALEQLWADGKDMGLKDPTPMPPTKTM